MRIPFTNKIVNQIYQIQRVHKLQCKAHLCSVTSQDRDFPWWGAGAGRWQKEKLGMGASRMFLDLNADSTGEFLL